MWDGRLKKASNNTLVKDRRSIVAKQISDMESKKNEIQDLGLNAIKEYFQVDVKSLSKDFITGLHNKARLAMQFEKEMSLSKRAVEMNYIRIFKMVAEDKADIKRMIKKHMPKYL